MGMIADAKRTGLWRAYERQVMSLEPVLQAMSRRGMPVNRAQYNVVEGILEKAKDARMADMQRIVPTELMPFTPKGGYKRSPKDVSGLVLHLFPDGIGERYIRLAEWKPSTKNLIVYMEAKGHEVPKHFKTNKPTTQHKEIARLYRSTKDPLYDVTLRYRKAATILTNHMANWEPGEDERVHSTFYFDPATGQLSSRRPNIQNAPAHDDPEFGGYSSEFRSMVKASPGHKIMEFDFHGFHVATLAFEARDKAMMRMGRLDIHSFVTAHFLHLPNAEKAFDMEDGELREYLAWVKKTYKHIRNAQVKHALLGYNNGMGYKKLFTQYMEFFDDMKQAKQVMSLLDGLFPDAKKYREDICMKAHEQGYLISRHGYIRFFWEVFRVKYYAGKPHYSHGDDHEAALCFFTQNDAHGELRERILTLADSGLDERFNLINTIHDSLMFEPSEGLVEECHSVVKSIMEAPSLVLIDPVIAPNGLQVDVDVKLGDDWASAKEI